MFDGVSLTEHAFHPSTTLPALHLSNPSPGSTSSLNDRHLEPPQTYEGLLAANTTLKTRVSELEVINDLFRGRVAQLEQADETTRQDEAVQRNAQLQLRQALEQSQRREDTLKRRVDELERQVAMLRDTEPRSKRQRLSDGAE